MDLTVILQEMTRTIEYQTARLSRKNFRINQKKKIDFLAYVLVRLAKLSHFEELFAKEGKVQIDRIMKINSRCTSRKKSHSTKLKLVQNYVNAYMFILIS
jgi:hypothetical protein